MEWFRSAFIGHLELCPSLLDVDDLGRNQHTFEDTSKVDSQILEGFILTLFDWSRAWGFSSSTSILEFISSLFLISHDVYP